MQPNFQVYYSSSADIHDLLALGEGISVSLDSGDESEDETDPKKVQSLASGSIEIAIEVPGKEKKKGKGNVELFVPNSSSIVNLCSLLRL